MTKKIYYIFTLIGSLLLSSCDSYLDIQPVGQVIPNTLAEYRALFTTAYNTALNDRGICEIRTDIATILQSDATSKNSLGDVEKWNDVNPNASTRQFGWAAYYTNIYYANAIIDKKDEISEGSQEDINQLVGEAYLMRAYMHFILVNLYGQPYTATGALETKAVPLKLNTDLEERINQISKFTNEMEAQGKKVYIIDAEAAVYNIPLNKYIKNYDMFLKGNIGKDGEDGIIEKINSERNNKTK